MKRVKEIMELIEYIIQEDRSSPVGAINNDTYNRIEMVLRIWGQEIINECAGSAEYTLEPGYGADGSEEMVPVLMRSTILDVLNKL